MFDEEEVIDGVLCHRGTPDGEWIPFTPEALTISLQSTRKSLEDFKRWCNDYEKALQEANDAIAKVL